MKSSVNFIAAGFFALVLSFQTFAKGHPGEGFLLFEAIQNEGKIDIVWKVNPTTDVKRFVVLRSKDGINFAPLRELNGSVQAPTYGDYFERDYSPLTGTSYYRLMEEKLDGQIFYSDIVPVNLQYLNGKWHIISGSSPTASKSDLNKFKNKEMLLVLRDKSGVEFFADVTISDVKGKTIEAKPLTGSIPEGKYLVVATSKDELFSRSISIVK
ncbi:MAG: hypothetical protein ACXVP0_14550 [Bacteroidia bacterium]